ncbi:MAG: acetoacetate--CoA ligase [Rubrivivax sp.]
MNAAAPAPTRLPRMALYRQWLARERGLQFAQYDELWRWSTTELHAFWQSLWDYFGLHSPTPYSTVLEAAVMPGARWFPGATLNYTHQVFRHTAAAHTAGHPALVFQNERGLAQGLAPLEVPWPVLQQQVANLAQALRGLGVQPGDRVVAYLPNTPHTIVAFLACASLGAIWSVCSPDMGPVAVLDRFRQIEPKVLIAVDAQVYGGVRHDRSAVLQQLLAGLPSLQQVVLVDRAADVFAGGAHPSTPPDAYASNERLQHDFHTLCTGQATLQPVMLPFDHPLWIVYSSGTTGLPKPIVHGHGGIVLEMLKGGLHNDIGPSVATGDRFHWYSSTGWIMWNAQLAALLGGTTVCVFDGNPGGSAAAPDWGVLWRFAGQVRATFFGAGAAFYASCLKAGVQPMQQADLSALRAVGSTGSPLSDACYQWIWDHLPRVDGQPIWLNPISGGTDFAGAFVAGNRELPVVLGEMQCRCLGAAIEAWSEDGRPLMDEVGELVCTQPMPSMPLYFWGDEGGRRYRDSYFDMFPQVWRHGDWIRLVPHPEHGAAGAIIYGRSDATINRHGIRMGTAELYRAVEALPEVLDSLVVDLEYLGRESDMPLFVVLREGLVLDAVLEARLRAAIKAGLSARHVPNGIYQVAAVPRTLSGKKMELPVKKLLLGAAPAQVMNPDAMANADCIAWYVDFAQRRLAAQAGATAHTGG